MMNKPPKKSVTLDALKRVTKTATEKHGEIQPDSEVSRMDAAYQKRKAADRKKGG
jgi:hypothetical protein